MNPPRALFLGRTTLDALYRLDRLPAEDTKVFAAEFHLAPGGPALNAALTHALLGGQAILVSAVGAGPSAEAVRAELARHGIPLLDLAPASYETPLCTVLLNSSSGSRTVVNPPVAQAEMSRLDGPWEAAVPASWGPMPPVVLCDGFHFAECRGLLTACREAGAALCLDAGSWKPGTAELAPLLTAAICSERFTVPGLAPGPESTFAWFAAQGVPYIAVTRGPRPILASDRGRRFEIEVARIDAADTLGAGDVLHGAFCHFFAIEASFEPALRRAARIATRSCQSLGVQAWAAETDGRLC
jgi:sugar/nucleoside kinase (ribokinase family)